MHLLLLVLALFSSPEVKPDTAPAAPVSVTAAESSIFIEGNYSSLTDMLEQFEGKVVYLDIWASWCGPCKRNFPAAKALHEKLKEEDVVFVYLAINDREPNWKAAITQYELNGYHYLAPAELVKEVVQVYGVQGIPRYMIIGKDGEFVSTNAPRPTDPRSYDSIKSALEG